MTVDDWFEYWIDRVEGDLAPNTRRNYCKRYIHNIQPVIGGMAMLSVKPMHCKMVLNLMEDDYAGSTIRQAYIAMGTLFRSAVMNELISKHPMDGVRYTKPVRAVDDIKFLTVEEQQIFLDTAKRSHNYNQYALILETGLRTGELIGLPWDAIDWEKRTLTVKKTLEYRHKQGVWRAGPPKIQHSYRTTVPAIPTCIKCVMRRGSSDSVRTHSAIPTPPGPSKAGCNPRPCKSSLVIPA